MEKGRYTEREHYVSRTFHFYKLEGTQIKIQKDAPQAA